MRLVKKRSTSLTREQTSLLLGEVQAAEKADRAFFDEQRRLRRYLQGDHSFKGSHPQHGEASITANLVHSTLRSMHPTLFFKEPNVKVRPLRPEAAGEEKTWKAVLNGTLRQNGFRDEMGEVTFDALLYHEGWAKTVMQVPDDFPDDESGRSPGMSTAETHRGPAPWMSKDVPVTVRIPPQNVIVDHLASGRDLKQARFVAVKYTKPLDELRKDPRYKLPEGFDSVERSRMSGAEGRAKRFDDAADHNSTSSLQQISPNRAERQGVEMVEMYEVWVYQVTENNLWKQLVVLVEGADKPIRMENWEDIVGPHYPGWPLERLVFNPVPDTYPMAEAEAWIGLQRHLNWVLSKIAMFVNHNNLRWYFNPDLVDDPDAAFTALTSDVSKAAIKIKGDTDPVRAMGLLPQGQFNADLYQFSNLILSLIERVSQQGANQSGQRENFRTATEAAVADRASQNRQADRVERVRIFLKKVVQKQAALIMENADTDYVMRIAGDAGSVAWERFTPEDILYMPDIDIEVDSFRLVDVREQTAKWAQLLTISAQLMPFLGPGINLLEIYKQFIDAIDVPNPEAIVGNLIGQRELQLLEIMMMREGQEVPINPTDAHAEHINAIDMYLNSPATQFLDEQTMSIVMAHRDEHEQIVQQAQQMASGQLGQNPIDGGGQPSAANSARSDTAREREAVQPQEGAAGAFVS